MIIYLIRHGQTNYNAKKICQGRSKNRLSEEGKKQARESAESLKNVKVDAFYSSPIMRTIQTANIINTYHDKKIIKDERITEIDQGILTKKSKLSMGEEEIYQKNIGRSKDYKLENFHEVYKRCNEFINYLKQEYNDDSTIFIVTHNIIASYLEKILKNEIDINKLERFSTFKNAEVKCIKTN